MTLSRLAAWLFGRRRRAGAPLAGAPRAGGPTLVRPVAAVVEPRADSSLDRGVRDIRRTDPRFDPSRFAGYAAMVFRDAHHGWMTGEISPLRDRVTPQMYDELQARCDRLRKAGHAYRVDDIDVTAEITGAWQDHGRDYLTASVGGSMIDYTVDDVSDALVDGSRATARAVDESWTFARPAGLNFWMLSAIQPAPARPGTQST